MRLRTAALVLAAAGAALLSSGSLVTAQQPSAARTLALVETDGPFHFVDTPPRSRAKALPDVSLGDTLSFTATFTEPGGGRKGTPGLACTVLAPGKLGSTTTHCSGAYRFADGTLEIAATSALSKRAKFAIVGGTGAYAGARGTGESVEGTTVRDTLSFTVGA